MGPGQKFLTRVGSGPISSQVRLANTFLKIIDQTITPIYSQETKRSGKYVLQNCILKNLVRKKLKVHILGLVITKLSGF